MIITRPDPLRKNIVAELRAIRDVRVALPNVTMQRKHLRSAGSERMSHAETNFIAHLRSQYWCLRIANRRRRTWQHLRQLIRQHTGEVACVVVVIPEAPRLRRIVDCPRISAVDGNRVSDHQRKLTES